MTGLDHTDLYTFNAAIAVNARGQAVAAWCQWDGSLYDLFASRYTPGVGWDLPSWVMDGNWTSCADPKIGIDLMGTATVAWGIPVGAFMDVWVARMSWEGGWGTSINFDDSTYQAFPIGVSAHDDGSATVMWHGNDGARNNVGTRTFNPALGWGTPFDADRSTNTVNSASMSGNNNGTTAAIWEDWDGARNNAVASVQVPLSGWGLRDSLETSDDPTYDSRIAVDRDGAVTAVWRQLDSGMMSIWAARKEPGAAWGVATLVEHDHGGQAVSVSVVAGAGGRAYVSWIQYGGAYTKPQVSEYIPSSGWQAPVTPSVPDVGDAIDFTSMASNRQGDVFLAFTVIADGQANQWVVRNHGAAGWEEPQRLEMESAYVSFAKLAASATGEAWAIVQRQSSLTTDIAVRQYLPRDEVAPYLSITSPMDGEHTNVSSVQVTGWTEPGASVSASGVAGAVDDFGNFDFKVPLTPGQNTIAIEAADATGNTMGVQVTVMFDDPAVALASAAANASAAAAAAQADLAVAQGELAVAQAELALAQANLTAAQARLAALEADAAATEVELAAARNDVTAAQGQIATLQTSLAATNARINQTGGGTAAPADSTGMILGVLGIVLGGAALAVAFMRGGKGGGGGGGGAPVTAGSAGPPKETPPAQPERLGPG